jgi:hypothetical protein
MDQLERQTSVTQLIGSPSWRDLAEKQSADQG